MSAIMLKTGLRSRKRDRLRAQLLETSLRLFIDHGYDATTIDEIAAAIDISPRTFFRYFGSKEDLVMDSAVRLREDLRAFAEGAPAEAPALSVAAAAMFLVARRYEPVPDGLPLARLIVQTPALRARLAREREDWTSQLAAGIAPRLGLASDAFAARVIAANAQWVQSAAFEQWVGEGAGRPLTVVLEEAFRIGISAYAEAATVQIGFENSALLKQLTDYTNRALSACRPRG
jgi:AcrR family transcriptional regulator